MPLPGGATDKFGNRYEGRWTVGQMAEVLACRADSIRLEPVGTAGEGIEFWVRRDDGQEYHQVKRQHSGLGHWTISALRSENVLSHIPAKLSNPKNHYVFVSAHAANELDELADRARRSATWHEFSQHFLKSNQNGINFSKLCRSWEGILQEDVYDCLKRIRIRVIDEDSLREYVEAKLSTLVEGDPATVVDILAQLALDKIHHELTAHDIWGHLEDRGHRRREWGTDPHVLSAVDAATKRYLLLLRREAISGKVIPRDEVNAVVERLTSPDGKSAVLVSGKAGTGKSSVIVQVIDALREQGWPVLAFRVDRLNPTQLPDQVGKQLELPGSPANVLASIAKERDCLLVIDQLDAVSLASGRHPQLFECIYEIARQAHAHAGMHLLIACRTFDLDNDHRLRRLASQPEIVQTVMVNDLSEETVKEIVTAYGMDASRLNSTQLRLLSLPLHLSLLVDIAGEPGIHAFDFKTAIDLYDEFWSRKQASVRKRLGRSANWTAVMDILCNYMSSQQLLSAPRELLDEYSDDAKALASEHVLTIDGQRYAFFHEGFFDYTYARRFIACDIGLLSLLLSGEQHLFRRAQVRQILLYERDANRSRYLADIRDLLTSPDIRLHLKQVVVALLAELPDPSKDEWEIFAPFIADPSDPLGWGVTRPWFQSVPWFRLLDSLGEIQRWLRSNDDWLLQQGITLLSKIQNQEQDRVAELVEPFFGISEQWRTMIAYLVARGDLSASRRFFDLFLRMIDDTEFYKVINDDFWMNVHSLSEHHPEWACEAIGHYLTRILNLSLSIGHLNPFDHDSRTISSSQPDNQAILDSARRAPHTFVSSILPVMLRVMELTANQQNEGTLRRDNVWGYRYFGKEHYSFPDILLSAMIEALSILATDYPHDFASIANKLRESDFETSQYLLVRAYTVNGQRFANEAADYIYKRPECLEIGYFEDSHWATRELLKAITPHCSAKRLVQTEKLVLGYYPRSEKSVEGRRLFGWSQFVLLDGILPAHRSVAVEQRIAEWKRKFRSQPEPPKEIRAGYVKSPVPKQAVSIMTSEQWLSAIVRYSHNGVSPQSSDPFVGGLYQLSRQLESQAQKEPERFAKLLDEFSDDTHPYYFDAILRGIAGTDLDAEMLNHVFQRCHELPNRPCGRWIAFAVAKSANLPFPKTVLDITSWYATEDPDPKEEIWRTATPNGPYYGGDPFSAGLNSVRGGAAEAIAKLILHDGNRLPILMPALERMVLDHSIAVRSQVAFALTAVSLHDRELAISLFEQLCKTDDTLLGTMHAYDFMFYEVQRSFGRLAPIVVRMVSSKEPDVRKAGARIACVAALHTESALPLVEQCLSGTEDHRIGVAQVFAANLRTAQFRSLCENTLIQLFWDPSDKVRAEVVRCFDGFEGEQLGDYTRLIDEFIKSPGFTESYGHLIRALDKTTAKLPGIICVVCERFLDNAGLDAADISTAASGVADKVTRLLVRVYTQNEDNSVLAARCLDAIDRMTQIGVYGLDKALASFER